MTLQSLPPEILTKIWDEVDSKDLVSLSRVAKWCHPICWEAWANRSQREFKFPQKLFRQVELLLDYEEFPGFPIDLNISNPYLHYLRVRRCNSDLDMVLCHSCRKQLPPDPELIGYLISRGARSYSSSLQRAAYQGHLETVKLLIDSGARDFNSALGSAAFRGHLEIVELLVSLGAEDRSYPVKSAACGGHLDIVKFLMKLGRISEADLNDALQKAAYSGHVDIVDHLLSYGLSDRFHVYGALEHTLCKIIYPGRYAVVEFLRELLLKHDPGEPVDSIILGACCREISGIQENFRSIRNFWAYMGLI